VEWRVYVETSKQSTVRHSEAQFSLLNAYASNAWNWATIKLRRRRPANASRKNAKLTPRNPIARKFIGFQIECKPRIRRPLRVPIAAWSNVQTYCRVSTSVELSGLGGDGGVVAGIGREGDFLGNGGDETESANENGADGFRC